jgi:4-hydroxybenzoate polyprenyltransferase
LVFVPLIFSGLLFDLHLLLTTFKAFLAFCAASSIGYIFNDWRDRKFDARHPKKKGRAFASGNGKGYFALFLSLNFVVIMILVSHALNSGFQKYLYLYLLGTLTYSLVLKNVPYVEILVIGLLFLCRIFAGASSTSVPLTSNFIIIVGASSMYFLSSKRLSEKLSRSNLDTRQVLKHYSVSFLRKIATALLIISVVGYLYWISQPRNLSFILWFTVLPIYFALVRFLSFQKMYKTENPVELFTKDMRLLICSGMFLVLIILEIYLV